MNVNNHIASYQEVVGNSGDLVDRWLDNNYGFALGIFAQYYNSQSQEEREKLAGRYGWLKTHSVTYKGYIVRHWFPSVMAS
jgi:hypothetical protein